MFLRSDMIQEHRISATRNSLEALQRSAASVPLQLLNLLRDR